MPQDDDAVGDAPISGGGAISGISGGGQQGEQHDRSSYVTCCINGGVV